MSSVGHGVLETNQVGNIEGRPPGGRGSADREVGDEARAFSWGQRGESRILKSHLRVKEGLIIYFHRAGYLRGHLDSICERCPGSSLSMEGFKNFRTPQRALQSLLRMLKSLPSTSLCPVRSQHFVAAIKGFRCCFCHCM